MSTYSMELLKKQARKKAMDDEEIGKKAGIRLDKVEVKPPYDNADDDMSGGLKRKLSVKTDSSTIDRSNYDKLQKMLGGNDADMLQNDHPAFADEEEEKAWVAKEKKRRGM